MKGVEESSFSMTMAKKMIEVETISQELIKPSSPTPDSFKSFKISILDQLFATLYFPLIFFYPSTTSTTDSKLASIKSSLSKILTQFYPLAGRIKDSTTIDCNDEGVLLIQSKVSSFMSDFLKPPENDLLNKLLPCGPTCNEPVEKAEQLIIQANVFECGGIALGICFLHKIIDGTTFSTFMKQWAQLSRENHDQENISLHNISSSVFPSNHTLTSHFAIFNPVAPKNGETIILNRILFDSDSISSLKATMTSENLQNPTRAEVVSGLLWKCMSRAAGSEKSSTFSVIVNLRPRLNPPLPDYSIGNLFWFAVSTDNGEKNGDRELSYFVGSVRKSVKRTIDPEFLKGLQGDEGFEKVCKLQEEEKEIYSKSTDGYMVSSLSRMGFYETDFSWGKPLWASIGPNIKEIIVNSTFLMETKGGDGIEAWIMLEENQMKKLEQDLEFQAYAKLNPNVV